MNFSYQSIGEYKNGLICVWTYNMGDDEEDVAMWEEASATRPCSSPEEVIREENEENDFGVPARGPALVHSKQKVEAHAGTFVSSVMERARQRHSFNSLQRAPRARTRRSLEDRNKVRLSMVSAMS
eukprot:CAMPEP_0113633996 /NCGR_PEP_ID=MMETSP0017_2-20120614/17697_1 /TAXON_ID=2856 /ORGANISM="Cylindrotheca closterium" /LENGTH=125 /DNA_ID=CAMNT_0000544667 /DNA_START=28 /DNA_END=405 /DNA_ORIENTATION=- /assembly_acc=CAM_ASM_000147